MALTLQIIFWALTGLVIYSYLLYPMLLVLLTRLRRPRPVRRIAVEGQPDCTLSVVISAFNEANNIARRIEEFLRLIDASGLKGELIVVSDGSTDDTVPIARRFESERMRVIALPENQGKAAALTAAVAAARHEIVVFADARQRWADDALKLLAENFRDPSVGAASGALVIEQAPGSMAGVGLYWRYEKWIRRAESRFGSAVGVTGAISAVRRELFHGIPRGTILDDVYWPMCVVMQGRRVVHDERPNAFDRLPPKSRDELRRKVRTLAGNFQLMARLPAILLPWKNPVWWQFMSHKVCRLMVPWALLALMAVTLMLGSPLYRVALAAQVVFYLIGAAGLWSGEKCRVRIASAISSFLLLNAAAWLAFWVWAGGNADRSWNKVKYAPDPVAES